MRWTTKGKTTLKAQIKWHKWFAWRPVDVGDQTTIWVWLERIERKRDHPWLGSPFDYRIPGEQARLSTPDSPVLTIVVKKHE